MYSVNVRSFVGGEFRLTCLPTRNPQTSPVKRDSVYPAPGLNSGHNSNPAPLVRSLDSETSRSGGVSGYGLLPTPTVFGLPARRSIARLSRAMDLKAQNPQDVIFFTGTLPGSSPAAMLALSQWSGYMVHRLKAWINSCSVSPHLVYCWEWQKRGALHLHLALWIPDEAERRPVFKGLRHEWIALLIAISEKSGQDLFARAGGRGTWRRCLEKVRARAEWVKKGVGQYLGKYLGKSASPGAEVGKFFFPSRWWGSTQNLKDLEKQHRREKEFIFPNRGRALSAIEDMAELVGMSAEWTRRYEIKVVRGLAVVALGVREEFANTIMYMLQPTKITMETKTLDQLNHEFLLCMDAIAICKPRWFKGFIGSWVNIDLVYRRFKGTLPEPIESGRLLTLTFCAASALEQSAKFDPCWNGEWLGEQMTMSAIKSARELQSALLKVWNEAYLHINDEEHVVRGRNDFL